MPFERFQQVGSFVEPVAPPIDPWDGGDLVALPCINVEWLRLLLGAGMQLLNPSSWDPALSDSARVLVLQRATDLLAALAELGVCVNPVIGASFDNCVLNLHMADGSTVPVTNWAAQFCECVKGCIPPVPPPNPGVTPKDQHACNLAGYMATAFLQECVTVAHNALVAGNNVLQFFQQLAADIATGNPFLEVLVTVAADMYPTVQAQPIADVAAVAGDVTLWSNVTCIIFSCIRSVGYLDATNFGCVQIGLGAMSYSKPWVPPLLSNAWRDAGLRFLQQFDAPGSLDDVDCTACSTVWCHEVNFRTAPECWGAHVPPYGGTLVGGAGFVSQARPTTGYSWIVIQNNWTCTPTALTTTGVTIGVTASTANTLAGATREVDLYNGATLVGTFSLPNGAYGAPTKVSVAFGGHLTWDEMVVWWYADGSGPVATIAFLEHQGTGVNPFGADNCE